MVAGASEGNAISGNVPGDISDAPRHSSFRTSIKGMMKRLFTTLLTIVLTLLHPHGAAARSVSAHRLQGARDNVAFSARLHGAAVHAPATSLQPVAAHITAAHKRARTHRPLIARQDAVPALVPRASVAVVDLGLSTAAANPDSFATLGLPRAQAP